MKTSAPAIAELRARLDDCLLIDRAGARGLLQRTERLAKAGKPHDRLLSRAAERVEASIERRAARRAALPEKFRYPADLPVVQRREEIAAAIANNQVIVLCGETGSGKTTQLPKICLELGRGDAGMIAHTQPRRLAARSVAARIATEMGQSIGQSVGAKVRFTDETGPNTCVKLLTDGMLLAETQSDRSLRAYDTIIIDEAHERGLNIDFLLGYLTQLLPRRPELKLIITSATIDPERFADHFGGAPIISVSGRSYPIELRYRDDLSEIENPERRGAIDDISERIRDAAEELVRDIDGDILVFLSGEREIRETARALAPMSERGVEILPLYARLSYAEQSRVFKHSRNRRIVLATNVAETSITVPGIRAVIDPGLARISRYSARSRIQRLPIEPISKASADQRKGRCGRLGPGVCIRLYAEDDFDRRDDFTPPEILRSNLAGVVLQMESLGLGAVEKFPFVDPPRQSAIREAYSTLFELGAIDDAHRLTPLGRELARLPVDPTVARMILAAREEDCVSEVLVIAAALSVPDPRERPVDKQDAADEAHEQFADPSSDFLGLLKLWRFYIDQAHKLSSSKLKKACQQNFLSPLRMREWRDIHRQLSSMTSELGIHRNSRDAKPDAIHRALLTGLLRNVGFREESVEYTGAGGSRFHIFPGSAVFSAKPRWVMSAEIVETSRVYARTVAAIDPEWIEPLAPHIVKRAHSEPRWDNVSGRVLCNERVTLFGLPVIPEHPVHFGPIHPEMAREVFIREGIVAFDLPKSPPFLQHNRKLVRQIRDLEAKIRARGLLADEQTLAAFYDQRLPERVYSAAALERWRKDAERDDPRLLFMRHEDALAEGARDVREEDFPDFVEMGGRRFKLKYHLEHGAEDDGVTLVTPLETVALIDPERLDWLVPGLLREKAIAVIRALPKPIRQALAPAPDNAAAIIERMDYAEGSFRAAFTEAVFELVGAEITPSAWRSLDLDTHLRMNIRVVDPSGGVIIEGRDLDEITHRVRDRVSAALSNLADDRFRESGITAWDFGELPAQTTVRRGRIEAPAFPALTDVGESVGIRLFDKPDVAAVAHQSGLRRLIALGIDRELLYQIEYLPGFDAVAMRYATLGSTEQLRRDLADLVVERQFLADTPDVRSKREFDRLIETRWDGIGARAHECAEIARQILEARQTIESMVDRPPTGGWETVLADVKHQLAHLAPPRFLATTPGAWLGHVPRYLRAIIARLESIPKRGLDWDLERVARFLPFWYRYLEALKGNNGKPTNPHLTYYRWMLEEYRVSLFAQEIGAAIPVSPERLERQWERVEP